MNMTGNFSLDLTPSVNQYFWSDKKPWVSIYDKFFNVQTTTERFKRFIIGSGLGIGAVKEEGAGGTYDESKEAWNIQTTQVTYSLGFKITREAMEDGHVIDQVEVCTRTCKSGMRVTEEIIHAQILNFLTDSGHLGGDGVIGLSTVHPTTAGGTYSNTLATPAVLSEASYESALILNLNMVDERNIPIQMIGDNAIMIHPNNVYNHKRVIGGTERPATADRDINALKARGDLQYEPIINPYLTNPNTFIIRNDIEDGFVSLKRRPLELNSINVQNTDVAEYLSTMRLTAAMVHPRGFVGSML